MLPEMLIVLARREGGETFLSTAWPLGSRPSDSWCPPPPSLQQLRLVVEVDLICDKVLPRVVGIIFAFATLVMYAVFVTFLMVTTFVMIVVIVVIAVVATILTRAIVLVFALSKGRE